MDHARVLTALMHDADNIGSHPTESWQMWRGMYLLLYD